MTTPTRSRRRSVAVPAAIAVVAAALALIAMVVTGQKSPGQAGSGASGGTTPPVIVATPSASAADTANGAALTALARRTPNDPMALGKADAPVVLINYSEFQCPFCGKFARDTEPALIRTYVDTGVLRIEWRDFPYLGQESLTAATAGRAAADQGKFWAFHRALFADQQPPNSGKLTTEFLTQVAGRAGLDTARFRADLGKESLRQGIEKDFTEGQRIGVNGTPAFLVNGQPIIGAQPLEAFEKAIDEANKAAKNQGTQASQTKAGAP